MNILMVMDVMDSLQQATSNGLNPDETIETFHLYQFRQWAIAAFRNNVESVAKLKSIKNIRDVRMSKEYQFTKFSFGCRLHPLVCCQRLHDFGCKVIVPAINT